MGNRVLTLLAAMAAGIGFMSAAGAADLGRAPPPVPVVAAVPISTWTGFYVGVNAGWAWGANRRTFENGVFVPAGTFPGAPTTSGTLFFPELEDRNNEGFTGGGQIGYNWQAGSFVFGAEADIQGIATEERDRFFGVAPTFVPATGPGIPADVVVVPTGGLRGLDWFGTVRARAGVAFDRVLVYATGGFAYGGGGGSNEFCTGAFFGCEGDRTRTGWTVGGGVEYAFTNNLTARIEGLYVSLGRERTFPGGAVFDPVTRTLFVGGNNRDDEFGVVRAGLNYKFSAY